MTKATDHDLLIKIDGKIDAIHDRLDATDFRLDNVEGQYDDIRSDVDSHNANWKWFFRLGGCALTVVTILFSTGVI